MTEAETVRHTPGPFRAELPDFDEVLDLYTEWHEHGDDDDDAPAGYATISGPDGKWKDFARVVVTCQGERDAEGMANLSLFLAAPDLLAACQALIALFEGFTKLSDSLIRAETDAIRAAIAKATSPAPSPAGEERQYPPQAFVEAMDELPPPS